MNNNRRYLPLPADYVAFKMNQKICLGDVCYTICGLLTRRRVQAQNMSTLQLNTLSPGDELYEALYFAKQHE